MSFKFEIGQELKVHKDLSDFKTYMRPKGTIYILSRKIRVDHKGIKRNRYKIAYEFHTNFLKIGDGCCHLGKDFVWEEDLMRAIGQRKNNYY